MRSISCLLLLFFTTTATTLIGADAQSSTTLETPTKPIETTGKVPAEATVLPQVKKEVTPYFNDDEEPENDIKHVEETHFGQLLVKMIVMLACVLTMLYIAVWFAKKFLNTRMQGLNRSSRIQILEKRALSPKSILYIIKVDEQEFVISEFPNGMQLIKEIPKS